MNFGNNNYRILNKRKLKLLKITIFADQYHSTVSILNTNNVGGFFPKVLVLINFCLVCVYFVVECDAMKLFTEVIKISFEASAAFAFPARRS